MNRHSRHPQGLLPTLARSVLRVAPVFILDGAICAASLYVGLLLRFDGTLDPTYHAALPIYILLLVPCRLVANFVLRVHRWSFSLSGLQDGVRVAIAGVLGTGLFVFLVFLFRLLSPPRSVVVLELLVSGAAMMALRFAPRLAWVYWMQLALFRRTDSRRTLIVGAGAAGEMLFRDLQRSADHPYNVVGFIDDDRGKWASLMSGRRVFGGLAALPDVIARERVTSILIAIPRDSQGVVREVVTRCAGLNVQIKALPVSFIYFHERGAASMLHDLSPDDLLSRRRVIFEEHERSLIAGRRVLVTGAAGSIGSEICRQLLGLGIGQLLAVDINENGLYLLEQRFKREWPGERFITQLADIRDRGRVESLMREFRPQDVFHAAAHKHVPLMEAAPCEAVKNNVIGTRHVWQAAERCGVECLVFISTDKAVAPTSVMGATKRVGEIMTRAMTARSSVRGCAVRFGNVLGSDGSVVPLFRQQIEAGGPVTVTDPEVRRYFMTIPEAVGLVLKAAYGDYGELCVLNMGEPIRILDLARQMIAMAGHIPDVGIPIVITGLRPGEKLNEELVDDDEVVTVEALGTIKVVTGQPPPPNLWDVVAELDEAASREDEGQVLRLLHTLVPSYQPPAARAVSVVSS
ncbi:MAG: nucleoside-diphosphate sugar epimerase/dehydratase [Vicinamibacterales bacterium]